MIVTLRCLLLVGCCAAPLGAMQVTTSPPAAATALPRSIADSNAAIDDAATLRKELDTLATLAPGVVRDARIAYRRIAFDLLFHGAAADFGAQEMVIAGLRMTAARNDLDRVLERTLPTTTGAAAVNEALRRFTAGAAQGLDPLPPTDHPERALAATLRPLEEAVALLERATPEPPGTAWPDAAQLAAESRPAVPGVADTIAQATWMDESTRTALREACARARSDGGTDALRADTECMRALGAGGRIAAHPEGWTAGAVASGFSALAGAYSSRNALRLADALAAADTCIASDSQALRADLRAAAADIRARALRDGIAVAQALPGLVTGAEPAAAVPMQSLAASAADLSRIGAVPAWIDAVAAARGASRSAFEGASRQWVAGLRDPARRDGVRRSMDAFASEVPFAKPSEFELRIRRQDPSALAACAGRPTDLLRELDARRAAWAAAWSNGRGTPDVSLAMLRAVRVTELLGAMSTLTKEEGVERRLGTWGGLATSGRGWSLHPKALAARSALALESLIGAKDADVDTDLAALERDLPLMIIASRLSGRLDPWLARRTGIGPALVAARDAPGTASYLGSMRSEWMQLSRCMLEESRAADRHLDDAERELRAMASGVAWTIAPQLDPSAARLRTLQSTALDAAARAPSGPATKRR